MFEHVLEGIPHHTFEVITNDLSKVPNFSPIVKIPNLLLKAN